MRTIFNVLIIAGWVLLVINVAVLTIILVERF